MNTPVIETRRLILRPFTRQDLTALFEIYSDVEVNRYLPWWPLKTPEEAAAFFEERYAAVYRQDRGYAYAVCLKEDNIPIGYVHVSMDPNHDLGYGLRKEFWRRGFISEAAAAVAGQVKADGLPYITATHDVNNPRSGHVMRSVGMEYKYSYEELWQPKNIPVIFRMYQLNFDGDETRVYREYWDRYENHFVEEL